MRNLPAFTPSLISVFIGLGDGPQIQLGNPRRLYRRAVADRAHQQAVQIGKRIISVDDLADMQYVNFSCGGMSFATNASRLCTILPMSRSSNASIKPFLLPK